MPRRRSISECKPMTHCSLRILGSWLLGTHIASPGPLSGVADLPNSTIAELRHPAIKPRAARRRRGTSEPSRRREARESSSRSCECLFCSALGARWLGQLDISGFRRSQVKERYISPSNALPPTLPGEIKLCGRCGLGERRKY